MDELNGLRILVVEDEFMVALAVETVLQSFGCQVVGPVGKLEEAQALARTEKLDGALLDVNLAGVESYPVAEILDGRGIPFIFTTGYDGGAVLPERFRDRPWLQKPFDGKKLTEKLKTVFLKA